VSGLAQYYPQFFTATVYEWKHLLKPHKYKQIITSSLQFLTEQNRVKLFCFAIMNNHLHLIWQIQALYKREDVQRDFLKYTAQKIIDDLKTNHPEVLKHFEVAEKDRKYRIWQRDSLSTDLFTHAVFMQKLEYIHYNPVKAGLCNVPEDYAYSSASFYELNKTEYGFLSHYNE
jgi:REP element-mobilizing transposase RayT